MTAVGFAFLAAVLATLGLAALIPASIRPAARQRRDARRERGEGRRQLLAPTTLRALATVARRVAPVARAGAPRDLHARIAAAGLTGPARGALAGLDARELMAAKLAAGALAALAAMLLGALAPGRLGVALLVAAPVGGFLAPDLWLAGRARDRARQVRRELPAMLDLLRVTVEAGLSLTAALVAVGERTRGVLGPEWRVVGREVALGMPLADSLRAMASRVPVPEMTALIAALERALRHGAPLAETLSAQARDARAGRSRRIREEAARAGPKIQLVVALLLVPAVLLIVAAALAAALIDGRGGLVVGV